MMWELVHEPHPDKEGEQIPPTEATADGPEHRLSLGEIQRRYHWDSHLGRC